QRHDSQVRADKKELVVQKELAISLSMRPNKALGPRQLADDEPMPGVLKSSDVFSRPLLKRGLALNGVNHDVGVEVVEHQLPPGRMQGLHPLLVFGFAFFAARVDFLGAAALEASGLLPL